jgi:hypothetical protein
MEWHDVSRFAVFGRDLLSATREKRYQSDAS